MNILELSNSEARKLLLKSDSYVNFDLPDYFSFDSLLQAVSNKILKDELNSLFRVDNGKFINPKQFENVNHTLLTNKDGDLAWRPFEIIHPVLYVALVNKITKEENWNIIKEKFNQFKNPRIQCESIPIKSESNNSDKAEQVTKWWEKVEQESIKLSLEYKYVFDTDIADCYGSIYTHSIEWALHTKSASKKNLEEEKPRKLLGGEIDKIIRMMRFGQTNGIPQGSMLMDFVAEIVLGHVDELLVEKLKLKVGSVEDGDFKIIRYRDDYKIFTNKPEVGMLILKDLSEVLSTLGIRLNSLKTKQHDDPVLASIKEDKIDELFVPLDKKNFSKWLFKIYATTKKHPNSGKVARQLCLYYESLSKHKRENKKLEYYEDPEVMISIIANLAIRNPKYYNWCMAILSILIDYCSCSKRNDLLEKIVKKFNLIPNTGLLDIWLQRISYTINPSITYDEAFTKLVNNASYPYPGNEMWCSSWLKGDLANLVLSTPIIDFKKLESKGMIIDRDEVSLFRNNYIR